MLAKMTCIVMTHFLYVLTGTIDRDWQTLPMIVCQLPVASGQERANIKMANQSCLSAAGTEPKLALSKAHNIAYGLSVH